MQEEERNTNFFTFLFVSFVLFLFVQVEETNNRVLLVFNGYCFFALGVICIGSSRCP